MGYMLVMAFGQQLKMSGRQQADTHKLISGALKAPSGGFGNPMSMVTSYEGLLDIKDADYAKAMGEDNWQTFKPQLAELKQQLDQMKNQGKGGEEAAEAASQVIEKKDR